MPTESIYPVFDQQRTDLLLHLLKSNAEFSDGGTIRGVVVYIKTKENLHAVTTELSHAGMPTESIHAGKKPELRERALAEFSEGKISILTMSESIARGLDISGTHLVVNYDIPELAADYGIRRDTLQADTGQVITMCTPKKPPLIEKINLLAGTELPSVTAEEFSYATRLEKVSIGKKSGTKGTRSKPLQNKKPKLRKGAKGGKNKG